jgi:hypothetical protein
MAVPACEMGCCAMAFLLHDIVMTYSRKLSGPGGLHDGNVGSHVDAARALFWPLRLAMITQWAV